MSYKPMSDCEEKRKVEEAEALRKVAFVGVAMSTVATMVCVICLPMLYNYVQHIQSILQNEMDFCKARSGDLSRELTRTQMLKHGLFSDSRHKRNAWFFGSRPENNDLVGFNSRPRQPGNQPRGVKGFNQFSQFNPYGAGAGYQNQGEGVQGGGFGGRPPVSAYGGQEVHGNVDRQAGYGSSNRNVELGINTQDTCCTCHQGAAGPPGRPGLDGQDGFDGRGGESGANGRDAPPGLIQSRQEVNCVDCPPGPPGRRGPPGRFGRGGGKGEPGRDGSGGVAGNQGAPGIRGPAGNPSPNGRKGPPGPPGRFTQNFADNGRPGPPGLPGRSGPAGFSGSDGRSGTDGLPGYPGDNGDSGTPGRDGLPGSQGPSGLKGGVGSCDHCPPPRTAPGY